jgi:hypothetical protein
MQPRPRCVEGDVTLRLLVPGADGVVLDATLRYDPSDPYAVKATFRAGEASVSWMLGRELLHHGLVDATGDGDVRVWPDLDADQEPAVMVRLSSPDGQAVLCLEADVLQNFLARTFAVVPLGREGEFLDVDGCLAQLLSGRRAS